VHTHDNTVCSVEHIMLHGFIKKALCNVQHENTVGINTWERVE